MKEERVEALVPQGATMMFCTHTQKRAAVKERHEGACDLCRRTG